MASLRRRARIFSATSRTSISISIAIAPACTAFRPRSCNRLLRAAYSQNYVYLIKEPDDQYQVILEVDDKDRARPEDLKQLYVRPDGKDTLVPVRTLTKACAEARIAGGQSHQPIHQRDVWFRYQTRRRTG